ncbi:MAG: ABC transporter permease [Candidatus Dormibacteraeota bacterium]|nr:ABC transporter permease [Candidatus Dormibacteraeota bacterium]
MNVNDSIAVVLAASAVFYGTPLVFAAVGELLAERSGVLNLGVEGMMLIGAVTAFWSVQHLSGPDWMVLLLATAIGGLAALATSLIHAILVVGLRANQIVSGLALTIFAGTTGLSSYVGNVARLGGQPARHDFGAINVLGLADTPVVGPILFHQNALVYTSWVVVVLALGYLYRTRMGLHLRAVGESPETADVMGVNVARYRYAHTLVGGLLAGVGGAYFSLAITPNWIDGMTSGAGWIAIALVIFAFWRPELTLVGAYLFGLFSSLGFVLQARQVHLPPEAFASLPYVMTVVVLVIVSTGWAKQRLGAPAALGTPYVREER